MNATEAKHFDRFSATNAAILESIQPDCKPYKDWFTYKRWKAQGKQVAKGEKGTRLYIIIKKERENKDGEIVLDTARRFVNVFHRHQLKN